MNNLTISQGEIPLRGFQCDLCYLNSEVVTEFWGLCCDMVGDVPLRHQKLYLCLLYLLEPLLRICEIAFRNAFVAHVSETLARFSVSGHFLFWQDLLNSDLNFREQNSMKPLAISLSLPPPLQSVLLHVSVKCAYLKYKPISNYPPPPKNAVLLEALSQELKLFHA